MQPEGRISLPPGRDSRIKTVLAPYQAPILVLKKPILVYTPPRLRGRMSTSVLILETIKTLMRPSMKYVSLAVASLLLALMPIANAQTVTGQITGTVVDSAGAIVAGASVQVTKESRNRSAPSPLRRMEASFSPIWCPPITICASLHPGFKTWSRTASPWERWRKWTFTTSGWRWAMSVLRLRCRRMPPRVATDTADHAMDVNLEKITVLIRGRNWEGIIKDLPGVIDMGTYDQRGWNGNTAIINGGQQGQVLVTFDGMAAQDSGAPSLSTYQTPSVDAIGEVKLLTGNYAAEYGARNGGQMNVTIKNGTAQFHGSAYYYYRHEHQRQQFNKSSLALPSPGIASKIPAAPSAGPSSFRKSASTRITIACSSFTPGISNGITPPRGSTSTPCRPRSSARETFRRASIPTARRFSFAIRSPEPPAPRLARWRAASRHKIPHPSQPDWQRDVESVPAAQRH